jgi:PAS domain S-box-containing protein
MAKEESQEDGASQNGDKDLAETIIDSLPGLFYMFDEEGRFLRWNKDLELVSGYSAEEIAGMTALDFFTEEGAKICLAATRIVFEEGENTMDNDLRTKDGRLIPHQFTGARRLIDGKPYLVGMAIDITERKRAEEALQRSQAQLLEAQGIAHFGSWEWDVRTGEVEWSDEVYRIFGLDPEQFTPQIDSILALSPPEERGRGQELVALAMETREACSYEQHFYRPDGTLGTYISTCAGRYDDDGNLVRMMGVAHDITERKQAEEERESLIQQLEAQNAELERFTYTVSHDLKSPLITIKGFLGVMADDLRQGDMDAAQDGFRRIARAADKMDELLKDLLELSRVGRIVNHSADVPLVQLAEDAMEIVRGQIEQKGVCVRIASDLPVAHGDPARLLEVLQNLIDNAVKYMGDVADPRIEIGSRRVGKETVCYVRDNGIGIDPNHLDRVFELFQQLDPNVEGSGIGLALVKRIVELHGGRVWFESDGEGHGATCCFSLPDAQENAS